jgi:hypothetical protein
VSLPWPPLAVGVIAGVAVIVLGAFIFFGFGLGDDGKLRQLKPAPGYELIYPGGKLLETQTVPSTQDAGAYRMYVYGTDATPTDITGFFDSALTRLGYAQVPPTSDANFSTQQQNLLRQYQNGPFTYRLYLLPLPRHIAGGWVTEGYAHILYAKLNN